LENLARERGASDGLEPVLLRNQNSYRAEKKYNIDKEYAPKPTQFHRFVTIGVRVVIEPKIASYLKLKKQTVYYYKLCIKTRPNPNPTLKSGQ